MASLILVLREGSLKQVLISLDEPTEQAELSRVAAILNRVLEGRTAADAERAIATLGTGDPAMDLVRRVGDRVVRALQEFDAAAIEELFSDGLLNVMAAPEFAQSEKLRRVFAALENRAYLAEPDRRGRRLRIGCMSSSAARTRPRRWPTSPSSSPPYGHAGRGVGVVGVLGPTRMAYPQAIGTVRFVSGLMNELFDHLYA